MIDSFTIRNYRTFKEVKVQDCRRVNVIVGDNASGKTALLEALFLAAGVSPELVIRTRGWRGYAQNARVQMAHEDLHEALWGDMFFKFQKNENAVVSLKGTREENRSVTVKLNPEGKLRPIPPDRRSPRALPQVAPEIFPVEFRWTIKGAPDVVIRPTFDGETLVFQGSSSGRHVRGAFLAANHTQNAVEVANRFSRLSRTFQINDFADRFQTLFPKVKDLSIELHVGVPMLYGRVDDLSERIPLSLASGGMNRLAGMLLTICDMRDGITLIDEVENGFYFERLPSIWQAMFDLSRDYNSQLFVSTHSNECLRALAPLVEENPDDFCFLRTVYRPEGAIIRRFDGKQFADAIIDNVEVR